MNETGAQANNLFGVLPEWFLSPQVSVYTASRMIEGGASEAKARALARDLLEPYLRYRPR